MAALIGVSWVHGIAFGVPVAPEENRTFVTRYGLATKLGPLPSSFRKWSQATS